MKFLITILLLISTGLVFAGDDHHADHEGPAGPIGPQGPPGIDGADGTNGISGVTSTSTTLITEYKSKGVASAIAAGQCQFDWTYDTQGCIPAGTYDGDYAVGYHVAKRYEDILWNGGIQYEEGGKWSAGGAMNWKFK